MRKIAVIGLGNITNRHRKNLKKIYPHSIIYAMSASGRIPTDEVSNADIVVNDICEIIDHRPDMAIVASPATLHTKHAIPLIEAGIPVLIEKPLAANKLDTAAVIEAANKYKTPVAVGYCIRYLSSSKCMKVLLEEEIIGKVYNAFVEVGQYLPDWRPNTDYLNSVSANLNLGGGALLELSHELDYAQWLFGSLQSHYAILRSSEELSLEVEDAVDILATNEEGVVVSIHLDFLQRKAYRKCRIIGSKGSIEWDLIENEITLTTASYKKVLFSEPEWDKNRMYLDMILDFENLISGKDNQCITLLEAKNTVSLIDHIKHSITNKK
ncbi:Gfo/Idh/MocA family protein [Psychrobacter jeotgali]|uniref:Gfo/Idh/MocA family protein n=1 Tax=Psychrobacter jeotgali TaxID=179010 RepID=UPI00191ABB4D|nr:Gfo/Idh/MocA family oxidoreductase [Psychrobacter jeotgali]